MTENKIYDTGDSFIKMILSLTTEKVLKVAKTCQKLFRSHSITFLELTKVMGLDCHPLYKQ